MVLISSKHKHALTGGYMVPQSSGDEMESHTYLHAYCTYIHMFSKDHLATYTYMNFKLKRALVP